MQYHLKVNIYSIYPYTLSKERVRSTTKENAGFENGDFGTEIRKVYTISIKGIYGIWRLRMA